MIDTKLILIEGIPGSGKSTTAWKLSAEIRDSGKDCRCFLEWDDDHPIFIGYERDISEIVLSFREREGDILKQWEEFARGAQSKETISIIESRFWQTTMMLMYLSGYSEDGVIESNQRVVTAITELKPALIYLANDDIEKTLAKAEALGGEVVVSKMEIPGVGWYGFFTDPSGNRIGLFTGGG